MRNMMKWLRSWQASKQIHALHLTARVTEQVQVYLSTTCYQVLRHQRKQLLAVTPQLILEWKTEHAPPLETLHCVSVYIASFWTLLQ